MRKLSKRQGKYPDSVWLHQQMKEDRQLRCRACMKCPKSQEMLTVRDFTKDSRHCKTASESNTCRAVKECESRHTTTESYKDRSQIHGNKDERTWLWSMNKNVRKHNPTYWQTRTWMLYVQAQGMSTTVWRPTRWVQAIVFTRSLSSMSQTTIHNQVEKDKSSLRA